MTRFFGNVANIQRVDTGYLVTVHVPEPLMPQVKKEDEGTSVQDEAKAQAEQLTVVRIQMSRIHYGSCWMDMPITDEECGLVPVKKEEMK
jgi:hypothetical protein